MRARTGRVKDQVAATQTRQALSSSLQGACLTEKRERKKLKDRVRDREEERARQKKGEHDRFKEREEGAR